MKAKPTKYNGYNFRSKLEATWAYFFDMLKVPYYYEPDPFFCKDGSQYTPDFYLPSGYCRNEKGLYIEIKPKGWSNDEKYKTRIATAVTGLVLFVGDPYDAMGCNGASNDNEQLSPVWDNCMTLMYCPKCWTIKAEFEDGNYMNCPVCKADTSIRIVEAMAVEARQYRFKYYEKQFNEVEPF